jgi:hypothetical protein
MGAEEGRLGAGGEERGFKLERGELGLKGREGGLLGEEGGGEGGFAGFELIWRDRRKRERKQEEECRESVSSEATPHPTKERESPPKGSIRVRSRGKTDLFQPLF